MREKLINIIEGLAKEEKFSGVVLINKDNKEFFKGAYGYAHRGWKIPNALDIRYGTASVTKVFTAVAVLQLIEKGLLNFDTKIRELLDLSESKIPTNVTIKHLLMHTSGIGDYFDEDSEEAKECILGQVPNYFIKEVSDLLPLLLHKEPVFEAGTKFSYCNGGYVLLGLAIEKVSGKSYFDYVKENVFLKAGMKYSDFIPLNKVSDKVAESYIPVENNQGEVTQWKTNVYSIPTYGAPDGGAFVTAEDLMIFMRALREGKLLSEEMSKAILTPQVTESEKDGKYFQYSYGIWFLSKEDGVIRMELSGDDPGLEAMAFYYPKHNIELVILSNMDNSAYALTRIINEMVINSEI
ncbi:beta-lactamase family protein [Clostridium sp. MSJ-4]|uniref:Beta-lactamase family protein n=1 Tax=Clostridium simiarum TaxID=2841506 RepID=A0ABS6F411_9CLOT|nr:serine hydrolase domain-containing protein [Clostridium simiarum]MBU5593036.1 beta-lactamase family protein [Clostridium simiarum]